MAEKQGSWGGAREGAGAKSKWQHSQEGTKLVRIPVAIESQVLEAARVIDAGVRLIPADSLQESVTKSSCNETVTESSERIQQLENQLEQLRQERDRAQQESDRHRQERDRLAGELAARHASQPQPQPQQLDLEAIRDRVVKHWKIQRRAESKERIQEALSKFIAELRSPT